MLHSSSCELAASQRQWGDRGNSIFTNEAREHQFGILVSTFHACRKDHVIGFKSLLCPDQVAVRVADRTRDSLTPATYQDVLDAPPHKVAELIDGVLYTFPRPASPQGLASAALGGELFAPFHSGRGGPGGWWILDEPELHLGEDVLVPDLAGWRRSRVPKFPDIAYWTIRPDWLCEVLSPSTRRIDLGPKRDTYAREGIPHMWLIDPRARSLEAFELREGKWERLARLTGDESVSLPPIEAVSFPLGELWMDPGTSQWASRGAGVHDSLDAV